MRSFLVSVIVVQAAKGREAGLTWEGEKVGSEGGGEAGGMGAGPLGEAGLTWENVWSEGGGGADGSAAGPLGLSLGLEKDSLPLTAVSPWNLQGTLDDEVGMVRKSQESWGRDVGVSA